MPDLVSASDIQTFQEDGAVCLRGVFGRDWLEKLAAGVEKVMTNPGKLHENLKAGRGNFFDDMCNWQMVEELKEFAFNSTAAEIAGLLMDSEYSVFYHEHILNKEPGATKPTPWHHDQPYYPVDGVKNCSIWAPLDPIPKETSLKFVRGSHRWGKWFYPKKFASGFNYDTLYDEAFDRVYENVPDIEGRKEEFDILHWEMEPGDCVVFHMLTLHGAAGNPSRSTHRRVVSTRWLGDDAILARRPWTPSPPHLGGLNYGDKVISDTFPLIWKRL